MSSVHDCTEEPGRSEGVQQAADAVRRGALVVLPTDTVYGIAADAFSDEAVAALLAAKGRGRAMPPPVLVPDAATMDGLAQDVPAEARALVTEFWPGALTIICWAQPSLAWDLGDTAGTVGLRMPDHELTLAVLAETGPLAVSSANRSGKPAATTMDEAMAALGESVEVYLDAGACAGSEPSTIVDATGPVLRVVRRGALSVERLRAVAPSLLGPDGEAPVSLDKPAPPDDEPAPPDDEPPVSLVKPPP